MAGRWIASPTVAVYKVGRNDDHPGLNWIVVVVSYVSGFGVNLGEFEAEADAGYFAQNVANTNNWSLRLPKPVGAVQ